MAPEIWDLRRAQSGGALNLLEQATATLVGCTFNGCTVTALGDGSDKSGKAVREALVPLPLRPPRAWVACGLPEGCGPFGARRVAAR
jgi:hypothetical protein